MTFFKETLQTFSLGIRRENKRNWFKNSRTLIEGMLGVLVQVEHKLCEETKQGRIKSYQSTTQNITTIVIGKMRVKVK